MLNDERLDDLSRERERSHDVSITGWIGYVISMDRSGRDPEDILPYLLALWLSFLGHMSMYQYCNNSSSTDATFTSRYLLPGEQHSPVRRGKRTKSLMFVSLSFFSNSAITG